MSKSLRCPWAENNINVSTSGHISTCCLSVPVIDANTNEPYNIRSHTVSQAFSSEEFETIRSNLRNGIRDQHCQQCWEVEDLGGRSIRIGGIEGFEENNVPVINSKLMYVNLDLSNQCNLKCRTCNPSDSSAWVEEYKNIYFSDKGNSVYKMFKNNIVSEEDFLKDIEENVIPNLLHLHFMGGEPFLIKQQWQLVDSIIRSGHNTNLSLSYHTNGTIWNNDIAERLSKFKYVEIALSIDDINQRFEYLRHPAIWSEVKNNILAIKEWVEKDTESRGFGINCTVSIYNVFTIKEILEFAHKHSIVIFLHPTTNPSYFSIINLPEDVKQLIDDKLKFTINEQIDVEIENLKAMLFESQSSVEQWGKFLSTTRIHDEYRKEDWKQTFPELYNAVKSYV